MKHRCKHIFLLSAIFLLLLFPPLLSALQNAFALRIACVGDSITYGSKLNDRTLNAYPSQLQRLLGGKYLVRNFGASGHTLQKSGNFPYWEHPAFEKSSDFSPDIVLLMLGINDSKPCNWTSTENFLLDYRKLLRHYQALDSSPKIILMTPATVFPESFQPEDHYTIQADLVDQIASAVRKLGQEENLPVIDVNAATRDHPEYFLLDGIHPNASGAAAIARLAEKAVRSLS